MATDRLLSHSPTDRPGSRHDTLALRWESLTGLGEGRILARGPEALSLYQSDLVDGFRDAAGGRMSLGRIDDHGQFIPLIRRTIPPHVSDGGAVLIPELLSVGTVGAGDTASGR